MSEARTLAELKREHGVHLGARHGVPHGEINEQSPVRNYVRDLVLGFNDGVVSVFAVTAGLAGSSLFSTSQILVGGTAAAVAGALSMAAGEYISTKSQAEFYAAERAREREHLARWPELEREELRESLEKKGIHPPLLGQVVDAISGDREKFLEYMMKEEFGVGDESERSPVRASIIVMLAFLLGAAAPVAAYVAFDLPNALYASGLVSGAALFAAGVLRARASRLPWFPAGVEMVFIGTLAAAIGFIVGRWLGVAL